MLKLIKQYCNFILIIMGILVFWNISFLFDNKYSIKTPLPQEGCLSLTQEILDEKPIFLIDDWRISNGISAPDNVTKGRRTWIGEFSNYCHNHNPSLSPYGSATYRLNIHYSGRPVAISLFFPNLCHSYSLWWDNTLLGEGYARANETLILTPGKHTITLSVSGYSGYYTGMYFPGAIGTVENISFMTSVQTACYGICGLLSLFLLFFCFSLWARSGNRLRGYFACFCLSFCGYLSHYFMQFITPPELSQYRFLLSDTAFYSMMYFAIVLMLEASDMKKNIPYHWLKRISFVVPVTEIFLYIISPFWYSAIRLHGMIQNAYRFFLFVCLLWGGIRFWKQKSFTARLLLISDCCLGIGLFINLLSSNLFEPAYTLWQFEWCSLALVLLFAILLEEHNRNLLLENQKYQHHLMELVEERTSQLNCLLEERRAFFSDMAHDLKAPLASIKSLIEIIRNHNVGMDSELLLYLEQVELQHQKMSHRVGSLNELNAIDRLTCVPQLLSLADLFHELYQNHNPEAVVVGIHLFLQPVTQDLFLYVQKEKILAVFENLFYNALRFTPPDGSIFITYTFDKKQIVIQIRDTGNGISDFDLPHIFERFYMGKNGKDSGGSGLGLYIVKSIVEEHGGSIFAESKVNEGAVFTISLPRHVKHPEHS